MCTLRFYMWRTFCTYVCEECHIYVHEDSICEECHIYVNEDSSCTWRVSHTCTWRYVRYVVASASRIDKIIGLFCKRDLWKRLYSAKETHNFIDPTNCSHPICINVDLSHMCTWRFFMYMKNLTCILHVHEECLSSRCLNMHSHIIYIYLHVQLRIEWNTSRM